MTPLDMMLSSYSQYRQAPSAPAATAAPTPTPVVSAPNAPFQSDTRTNSFFSASGPGNVSAGAISTGFGTPGGLGWWNRVPDLSQASPQLKRALQSFTQNYIYSVPAGGYISAVDASNANSAAIKYNMQNPEGNRLASSIYGQLGDLPTIPAIAARFGGFGNSFFGSGGGAFGSASPFQNLQGPSTNELLDRYGLGGPWQGPWQVAPERQSINLSGWTGG